MTTIALNNLWTYLQGLSLSQSEREWLAEHLIESVETNRTTQRELDEQFVRELQALHYEGELSAEEKKRILRESRSFVGRNIKHNYPDEE